MPPTGRRENYSHPSPTSPSHSQWECWWGEELSIQYLKVSRRQAAATPLPPPRTQERVSCCYISYRVGLLALVDALSGTTAVRSSALGLSPRRLRLRTAHFLRVLESARGSSEDGGSTDWKRSRHGVSEWPRLLRLWQPPVYRICISLSKSSQLPPSPRPDERMRKAPRWETKQERNEGMNIAERGTIST